MTWANILAGFVKLASLVMAYVNNRQLLDAGEAKADAKYSAAERERLDAANRARLDAAGGVFVDPFDAANRSSVQGSEADLVRQPGDTPGTHRSAS